jgi:hypothetical protein
MQVRFGMLSLQWGGCRFGTAGFSIGCFYCHTRMHTPRLDMAVIHTGQTQVAALVSEYLLNVCCGHGRGHC